MTRDGISINGLGQSQDDSGLESKTAKRTTIQQTLSGDGNGSYLPHLLATVAHLLIGQVGHLQPKLLDQSVVNVGRVGCWDVRGLQDREGPSSHNKNVFLNTSTIFKLKSWIC